MICQNCGATVANDLVFCTECGARLHETMSQTPTELLNNSVVTKISAVNQPKSSSNLKWLALIVGLLTVSVGGFFVYVLMSNNKNQVTGNFAKTANTTPTPAVNKSQNFNLSANAAKVNQNVANANSGDVNSTVNENRTGAATEIWNEQIEIAPGEHYAVPFKLETDSRVTGKITLVSGESISGFVYLQTQYDEHFPDPTYKMFSFEGKDEANINARLVKENYVLIFVNQTGKPLTIKGNFSVAAE